jgi:hypothetical protein
MKKTAFAILVMSLFAASSAMAATEVSLNGYMNNLTQSSSGTQTGTDAVINLNGAFGYYFSPQLVGRVVANVYNDVNTPTVGGSTTTTMEALGVGGKYYLSSPAKGAEVFFVFADVSALSIASGSGANATTGSGTQLDVGGGLSTFLTESVSFDLDLKYVSDAYTISGFSISSAGPQFDFGLTARF